MSVKLNRGTTVDRCVEYALSGWPLRKHSKMERELRRDLHALRRENPEGFERSFRAFLKGKL